VARKMKYRFIARVKGWHGNGAQASPPLAPPTFSDMRMRWQRLCYA
jgi:hypothetical protein